MGPFFASWGELDVFSLLLILICNSIALCSRLAVALVFSAIYFPPGACKFFDTVCVHFIISQVQVCNSLRIDATLE